MDTRGIVRRSVQGLTHGFSTMSSHSRESSSTANSTFKHLGRTQYTGTSFRHEEFKNFTVPGVIRAFKYHTIAGHTSPMRFHSVLHSARFSSLVSQSARFSSVASAPKPDLGKDEDNNEQVAEKRKEASSEECHQAVEGLTSAMLLTRTWAMLLGIGPALRAVASTSRQDWAKKLVNRKTEFVDTLKHYWLGIKLLGVDVKIGSRLFLKLACGMSLSRRDGQQLTKLLGISLNKDGAGKRHLIRSSGMLSSLSLSHP